MCHQVTQVLVHKKDWDSFSESDIPDCASDCPDADSTVQDMSNTEFCIYISEWTECLEDCAGADEIFITTTMDWCMDCLENNNCDNDGGGGTISESDIIGSWMMSKITAQLDAVVNSDVSFLDSWSPVNGDFIVSITEKQEKTHPP